MLVGWLSLLVLGANAQEGTTSFGGAPGTPDFYLIQEGDTLWDISTRFLGDPYEWPQLWSVNEYITNPHWIYPGNRIYFNLGDALNAPSAGVSEPTMASADGYVPAERAVASAAEAACDFPPRFDGRSSGIAVSAPGVLADEAALEIRGKIYKSDVPGLSIGEGAIVFLDMDDVGDVACGDLLGIYRRQGKKVKGAGGTLGRVYRVLGVAQVLRVDDDIVTAVVRDSWFEASRGDLVGTPVDVDLQIDLTVPGGDIEGKVVARLTDEQWLASTGETVFLDRGTNDGVEVGAALYLVERREGSDADAQAREDKRLPEHVIGRVVVVRADAASSTAVVTNAARDIQVGARVVGTPNADE
jgi:hypothetical protein